MTRRDLRYLLEYCLYWPLSRAVRLLPHRLSPRLGAALGRLSRFLLPSRRRLARENLQRVLPRLDGKQLRRIAGDCFGHWGGTYLESVSLARFAPAELAERFELEGPERLRELAGEGRGLILLAAHFGSFELASYALSQALGSLCILVRPLSNPMIERETRELRQRTGHVLVPRRRSGPRLLTELRRGGVVGMAIDQRVPASEGLLLPFLGVPAWTSSVPAFLSTVTGAPVVLATSLPLGGARHRVSFGSAIRPRGRGAVEVERLTRAYLAGLESAIRGRPELWLWMHRRWRRTDRYRLPGVISRLRADAGLPAGPVPAPDAALIRRLDQAALERGDWLVLRGGGGEPSTGAALAVADRLLKLGHSVLWRSAPQLAEELRRPSSADQRLELLQRLDRIDLLVLVDWHLLAAGSEAEAAVGRLLDRRRGSRSVLAVGEGAALQPPFTQAGELQPAAQEPRAAR